MKFIRVALASFIFGSPFLSMPALAYSCVGPVNGLQISPAGVVSAASYAGLSWVHLCSVETTTNGVSPATCKSIYALLLTAQTTGKRVTLWFNDDPNTCASHTPWTWITGWYWGPMIED